MWSTRFVVLLYDTCVRPDMTLKFRISWKVITFFERKTTQTAKKEPTDTFDFPQMMFCPAVGYKSRELAKMSLAEGFLQPHFTSYPENFNLTDIDELWKNGTYQRNEFDLIWWTEDGKFPLTFQLSHFF